jgi:hypothetical protein
MRTNKRAESREAKRIYNTLIKHRDRIETVPVTRDARREAYFSIQHLEPKYSDGRLRIAHELLNRTTRKREALLFEISASGESFFSYA